MAIIKVLFSYFNIIFIKYLQWYEHALFACLHIKNKHFYATEAEIPGRFIDEDANII